jgi:hypothetical protein
MGVQNRSGGPVFSLVTRIMFFLNQNRAVRQVQEILTNGSTTERWITLDPHR